MKEMEKKIYRVRICPNNTPSKITWKVCASEEEAKEALREYMERISPVAPGWFHLYGTSKTKTTVVWSTPTAALYVRSVSVVKNGEENIHDDFFRVYIDSEEVEAA